MAKRQLPEQLIMQQERRRTETLNNIQNAINLIHEEGGVVSKKKLIEATGLSNSIFSKSHVKELLAINKVCQYKEIQKVATKRDASTDQLLRLNKKINLLESKIVEKDIKYSRLESEYDDLLKNYQTLLGKMHIIMRAVENRGFDIGIDFDDL